MLKRDAFYVYIGVYSWINENIEKATKYFAKSMACVYRYTKGNSYYLLYISTSGFHSRWGGIRKSRTPPYSDEFHLKFISFHS